jgi:hypothetical protein
MSIFYTVVDINPTTLALTGNHNSLIRGHSTAQASMNFAGTVVNLDTCLIRNGEERVWGTEATFANVTSNRFEFHCEDDQYNHIDETVTAPMVEYISLTCHAADSKPDATGGVTLVCSGDFFNGSFGAESNTLSVKYTFRERGGTWSGLADMTVNTDGNTYSANANLSGLDYQKAYDFEFVARDRLMTVSSASLNVVSKPVFHWGENDVVFEVPVTFNEAIANPKVKGVMNFEDGGTAVGSVGGYGGYLVLSGSKIAILGDVEKDGRTVEFPTSGTWTPSLVGCSGVYWSLYGWYTKCGNTVTVGFNIKIDCDSGYNYNDIIIGGLPFTPAIAAAGGGMCSGAYVSGAFNFQCFVAETSGLITTRVQSCNHTAAENLRTSASGCKYSANNGTLTLSGTITYMTA